MVGDVCPGVMNRKSILSTKYMQVNIYRNPGD